MTIKNKLLRRLVEAKRQEQHEDGLNCIMKVTIFILQEMSLGRSNQGEWTGGMGFYLIVKPQRIMKCKIKLIYLSITLTMSLQPFVGSWSLLDGGSASRKAATCIQDTTNTE
jgi:hypothetical protein